MAHEDQRSDEQLLAGYCKGESGNLEVLIFRHQQELNRFLVRFLNGDQAAADDVLQETFLQVHLSGESFDSSRRFKPWLFTIAANKARDLIRKTSRRPTVDLSAPVGGAGASGGEGVTFVDLMEIEVPAPDAALDATELSEMVQRALDSMSPILKEVLLLAYFQKLPYAQIADDLGIPLGTVKSRLHSAVGAFAKSLQAISPDHAPGGASQ